MTYLNLQELAAKLKNELDAVLVTTDPYRRGEIVHAWSLLLNPKFRHGRWFGPAHSRIFDRIFLVGEALPPGVVVYHDELVNKS